MNGRAARRLLLGAATAAWLLPAARGAAQALPAAPARPEAGPAQEPQLLDALPGAQRLAWPAGRPTPVLELPQMDGASWRLSQALGQVVLLNFWASWCEPCLAELPSLERLADRLGREGLRVMAVNHKEHETTVRRFLQRHPLQLPVLRDGFGDAARDWQVRIFPSTVAIGRDGRAVFTVVGQVDWGHSLVASWIRPLLRARAA